MPTAWRASTWHGSKPGLHSHKRRARARSLPSTSGRRRKTWKVSSSSSISSTWTTPFVRQATELAEAQALRAYDAVHLAAALQVIEPDLVLVAGDRALLTAAESVGVMVAAVG